MACSVRTMIALAEAEVGYVETPVNHTKYGRWYGLDGQPWCDQFISYLAHEAKATDIIGKFAYTPDHARWFKSRGQWGAKPRLGAIAFYDFPHDGVDRISHVGLVVGIGKHQVTTIEGNTSRDKHGDQRNGGEVCKKVRDTHLIVGYGYPEYLDSEPVRYKVVKRTRMKKHARRFSPVLAVLPVGKEVVGIGPVIRGYIPGLHYGTAGYVWRADLERI